MHPVAVPDVWRLVFLLTATAGAPDIAEHPREATPWSGVRLPHAGPWAPGRGAAWTLPRLGDDTEKKPHGSIPPRGHFSNSQRHGKEIP